MKTNILFAALMAIGVSAAAQNQPQTVERTLKLNNGSKLVYNIDPDTKMKNGLYAIQSSNGDKVWMQGNYKEDNRTGSWYFFDAKNNLAMRYNYDQKKLIYMDTTALANVSVKVLSNDEDVVKNASAPLPLCSVDYLVSVLGKSLSSPNEVTDAEITAHIDAEGKASYTVVYIKDQKKLPAQRIYLDAKDSIDWLPSVYKKEPVDAEFTVYASLKDGGQASAVRRFRWDN